MPISARGMPRASAESTTRCCGTLSSKWKSVSFVHEYEGREYKAVRSIHCRTGGCLSARDRLLRPDELCFQCLLAQDWQAEAGTEREGQSGHLLKRGMELRVAAGFQRDHEG